MAGEWDLVEEVPVAPGPRVPTNVPYAPSGGARNPLTPSKMRVLATAPPRVSTAERVTFRKPTPEELDANPGLSQVDSRGEYHYLPAGVINSHAKGGKVNLPAQDYKYLGDQRKSAEETRNMAGLLDEFVGLNDKVDTGGLVGAVSHLPGINGIINAYDPVRSRMSAIVSQVTPGQRNGLPGAASDKDVAMFRDSTVGLDKPKRANQATRDAAKALATRHGDYIAFLEAFAKKNGNLLGAQEQWNDYRDAHPLYEGKDDDGFLKLAPRVPWRSAMPDLKMDTPANSAPAPANAPAAEEHWARDPKSGKLVRVK